jgi:putative tricarboxylic transport membrane protein
VPNTILFPVVLVLSLTGVYVATNSLFDIGVMLGFGVLGYGMNKCGFPVAPLLIGFILGPLVEVGLRQSLILGHGDVMVFFRQPISALFLSLAALTLVWTFWREWRTRHPKENP